MGSSKTLFVMLLALALHASATVALPVIHVINSVGPKSPPIKFSYQVSKYAPSAQIQLSARQDYQINVRTNEVYSLTATLGLEFASVFIYNPTRDSGKSAVFWKADSVGWSTSYDNVHYKRVKDWESE